MSHQANGIAPKLINEWANVVKEGMDEFEIAESGILKRTGEALSQMESHIRWSAQTTHQAYHDDQPGYWWECPKSTCDSARQALGIDKPE